MRIRRDVYSGTLKLWGEEHRDTLLEAYFYASLVRELKRFKEARKLLQKSMLIARRVLGENDHLKISMRLVYARALHQDPGATLDDLREAVTTLEETLRTARRVLGGSHPTTVQLELSLRDARAALRARETAEAP